MNNFNFFSQTYWADSLSDELEIWYDNVENEPENGINWEFEWEALDSDKKDRKDDLTIAEYNDISKAIRDYISDPNNRDDDF